MLNKSKLIISQLKQLQQYQIIKRANLTMHVFLFIFVFCQTAYKPNDMTQNHGFVKVAAAIPKLRVADCRYNAKKISEQIKEAAKKEVEIICFPELSITSAGCGNLFFNKNLLNEADEALKEIVSSSAKHEITAIVGMPVQAGNKLYNSAVVINRGKILAAVPQLFPSGEKACWFSSGAGIGELQVCLGGKKTVMSDTLIFRNAAYKFAIEVGSDRRTALAPGVWAADAGADIIFNPAAEPEVAGKHETLMQDILAESRKQNTAYVYSSAGYGESTTDRVFAGNAVITELGEELVRSERFSFEPQLIVSDIDTERTATAKLKIRTATDIFDWEFSEIKLEKSSRSGIKLHRKFASHPFLPLESERESYFNEVMAIQVGGLAKRWQHTGLDKLVIGVSGGLDSTLALLVCVKTADKLGYDRRRILGVTMPGFGTTERTYHNAVELMDALGISTMDISIKEASLLHFRDIGHDPDQHDVTYENVQARERTQILMDLANKQNGLVVGTGDLSEIALGWSTYNGDHISMYGVNSGVPKTLMRAMIDWYGSQFDSKTGDILRDIFNTPVSPELLPTDDKGEIKQITEDLVGPYELHDFFLYYFVKYGFSAAKLHFMANEAFEGKYDSDTIKKWLASFLRRFVQQQFKRSCSPDGPQVTEISLSPRGGWNMPSDAHNFFKKLI